MNFKNIFDFFKKTWVILAILIILSFTLRIWHLGSISEQIFDEVYFVKFAQDYLSGTSFFDIHPPLGKLIIALGIKIFGDTPFGWRIMPAIFGTLLIPLGYLTGKEICSKTVGLLVAIILALDGMLLVYSRTGLIDIFLIFFVLLSFFLFLKFADTKKLLFLILAGISLGLATSIKYIGGLVFLTFVLIIIVKKIPLRLNLRKFIIFLIIIPILIYLSFFLFNFSLKNFWGQVFEWHWQSLNYNITLKEGHPYASKWWGWFLLLRPIWLYFKDLGGTLIGINGLGNPLAWWSSIAIVPLLIWGTYKGYKNHLIILGSFLIFLIFWAPFARVLFFYHALPSFVFLGLGTALWLERLTKVSYGKYYLSLYLGVLFLLFIFFLPIWIGLPLESNQFYFRIWFKGWI